MRAVGEAKSAAESGAEDSDQDGEDQSAPSGACYAFCVPTLCMSASCSQDVGPVSRSWTILQRRAQIRVRLAMQVSMFSPRDYKHRQSHTTTDP
jgi:hypothetical protein